MHPHRHALAALLIGALVAVSCASVNPTILPATPATEATPSTQATPPASTLRATQSAAPMRTVPPMPAPTASSIPTQQASPSKPNIVVVMIDDLAEMDTRMWERLPTIKAMFLDDGVRFTNYYGNDPLCCPGRSNFVTGQYTDHHGVWWNNATLLNPSVTLATQLQSVGYYTFISGKYLNLTERLANKMPPGWTQAAIYSGGYYNYDSWINGALQHYGTSTDDTPSFDNPNDDYSTDVFANYAVSFIERAPTTQPIFAFLTPFAVHGGKDANGIDNLYQPAVPPRYRGDRRCAGIAPWKPANYNEADVSDKPAYIRNLQPLGFMYGQSYAGGWPLTLMCESLLAVDEELARVITALGPARTANTLFILTADNGMGFGAHRWPKKNVPFAAQLPLFMHWASQGLTGTNTTFVENVDWAPTLCELAGCTMPAIYPDTGKTYHVDGQSVLGLFAPRLSSLVPRRDALYMEHREASGSGRPVWRALITTPSNALGPWFFVNYDGSGEKELYRLSSVACGDWKPGDAGDPCMLNNLANKPAYAAVQRQLAAELRSMVVDKLPSVP